MLELLSQRVLPTNVVPNTKQLKFRRKHLLITFHTTSKNYTMSQILWTTTVAQLLQRKGQKPFLQLDKLTTLDTALTKLKQENQRFAAVFDDLSNAATYLGTVDMFDIISFILAFYRKEEVVETRIGVLTIEEWNTDIRTLTKDNEIFKNTTLDYVIELAKKNRKRMLTTSYVPYTVYEGDSLALAIKAFVYEQGLYYLPVVRENKVIAFLAQEDFLPYLLEHRGEIFGKDLSKSVEAVFKLTEYGSEDKIVKVSQNDMTIIAFDRITQEKISALAVVDRDSGRLLANFSASDLMVICRSNSFAYIQGIVGESISDLRLPVLLFLQKYAQNGFPPISSENDLTIDQLLNILHSEKVRRIWITNPQKQPVGVLSLSDILNLVYTVLDYQTK